MKTHLFFRRSRIVFIFSVLAVLVHGCNPSNTPVKSSSIPMATNSPTMSVYSKSELTLTQTRTANISTPIPPTSLPGLPATWTPLPTYPPEIARKTVYSLFENNTCELPCWWGITPGKTDWREAWQFLGQFATNISPWQTLLQRSHSPMWGYLYYRVYLDIPEQEFPVLDDLYFFINIETFKVDYINVNTGNFQDYTIPGILSKYGKPDEVYLYYIDGYDGPIVFLYMYYPKYGFVSTHLSDSSNNEDVAQNEPGTETTVCFQKFTNLFMWPKEKKLTFNGALQLDLHHESGDEDPSHYTTLAESTKMTIDEFYRAFVDSQNPPCIRFSIVILHP